MYNMNYGMYSGYEAVKDTHKEEHKVSTECTNSNCDNMNNMPLCGCVCPPVMECPKERQIHRQIIHEVPHVCPVNTRIINHHIYRHTYSPLYTCNEENECSNMYEGSCNQF